MNDLQAMSVLSEAAARSLHVRCNHFIGGTVGALTGCMRRWCAAAAHDVHVVPLPVVQALSKTLIRLAMAVPAVPSIGNTVALKVRQSLNGPLL